MKRNFGSLVSRVSKLRGGRALLALTPVLAFFLMASSGVHAAPPVTVDSADPPAAEQATFDLDVTINGKGFDNGSQAEFLVTGSTNPGGVTVKSTTFVSSKKLIARIDIAVDATVGAFDIEVQTARGRRGKGTETFAVLQQGSGGPSEIIILGTMRDAGSDRLVSDGNPAPYEDVMPGTGNLVFQMGEGDRTWQVLLLDDPETIENGACDDDPSQVCLRDGSTRVAMSYESGFVSINKLDVGLSCDGDPVEVWPRDMFAGECIKAYIALTWDHPGIKPRAQMRLRCGKHPHEGGDHVRLECLAADTEGCQAWDLRPFLDGGGNEHLTCQLYHRARKGNEENLELAEYDMVFGMTIARQ